MTRSSIHLAFAGAAVGLIAAVPMALSQLEGGYTGAGLALGLWLAGAYMGLRGD